MDIYLVRLLDYILIAVTNLKRIEFRVIESAPTLSLIFLIVSMCRKYRATNLIQYVCRNTIRFIVYGIHNW